MDEKEFLQALNEKASEQKRITETEVLPGWAKWLGEWLAIDPWRVLMPTALILYLVMRVVVGVGFRELILAIFGGF